MTVEELKAILDKQPHGRQVMLSIDGEGNAYKPLDGYSDTLLWDPAHQEPYDPEDETDDREPSEGAYPVLILWPVG